MSQRILANHCLHIFRVIMETVVKMKSPAIQHCAHSVLSKLIVNYKLDSSGGVFPPNLLRNVGLCPASGFVICD